MQVCDDCGDENPDYEDRDGISSFCSDDYLKLDPDYIVYQGIRLITDQAKAKRNKS